MKVKGTKGTETEKAAAVAVVTGVVSYLFRSANGRRSVRFDSEAFTLRPSRLVANLVDADGEIVAQRDAGARLWTLPGHAGEWTPVDFGMLVAQ